MNLKIDLDPFGQKKTKKKRRLTAADKKRIAGRQNWKCKKCKKTLPTRHHIDHIKEFSKGGSDKESNLRALCPNCHAEKTENDRHKARQKKIKAAEKSTGEGDILGIGNLLGPKKKRKRKDDIWGIDDIMRM